MKKISFILVLGVLISSCVSGVSVNQKSQVMLEAEYWFNYDWTNDTNKIIGVDGEMNLYDLSSNKKENIIKYYEGFINTAVSWFPSNNILLSSGSDDNQSIILINRKYLEDTSSSYVKEIIKKGANPSWIKKDTSFIYDTSNDIDWIISEIFFYNMYTKENIKVSDGYLPSTNYKNLVVFCGLKNGHRNGIFLYDVESNSLKQITNDPTDEQSAIDKDGKFIIFTRGENQLWMFDLQNNKERKILSRKCFYPKFSPFDNSLWVWLKIDEDKYNLVRFDFPFK